MWLGWSLGDVATSAVVLLCETEFAKQRALISLADHRPAAAVAEQPAGVAHADHRLDVKPGGGYSG